MTIFNKKNKLIIYFVIVAVLAFSGSFIAYSIKSKLNASNKKEVEKSVVVNTNKENKLLKNIQIVLEINYQKSGETKIKSIIQGDQFKNATIEDIIGYYENEGYYFQSNENNKVVFIKKVNLYSPNKYVIGIKNEKVVIYKTDNDGNSFIENEKNDITNISIKNLSPGDVDLINRGDPQFQYDTRDGAASKLEDYI